ncbi:MAG: amidase [Enterovirga sp.]|nr:amidase [Enterovirga sp.]
MSAPSVRDKVEDRLARIGAGGSRNVFTRLYPDAARAAADAADARHALGIALGPLDGTIASIKDLFDVKGEPTGAGSAALASGAAAAADSPVVRRLRRAGAVILGKTNMSEFAFTGLGLNPHCGTPGNALDPRLVPGGSSSGAGVSAGDGSSEIAIGTDTGGSVRIPAALNRVVGFKPTVGRVPVEGAFPLSYTLDSIGPLARTVAECAAAAAELTNAEPEPLRPMPLSLLRIGVPRGRLFSELDPEVERAFEAALSRLSGAGARVVDIDIEDLLGQLDTATSIASLPAMEAAEIHGDRIVASAHLIDPNVLARIRRGASAPASHYVALTRLRRNLAAEIDRRMEPFDTLALPTVPLLPPTIASVEADPERFARANLLMLRNPAVANLLDLCSISLPNPGTELPIGFMLFGRHGRDRELLDAAASMEAAFRP